VNIAGVIPAHTFLACVTCLNTHLKKCTKVHEIAQFFLCIFSPFSPVTARAGASLHGARKMRQLQRAGGVGQGARIEGWKATCFIWGRIARDTHTVKPVLKNHIKT
jgi:hypothetical protein